MKMKWWVNTSQRQSILADILASATDWQPFECRNTQKCNFELTFLEKRPLTLEKWHKDMLTPRKKKFHRRGSLNSLFVVWFVLTCFLLIHQKVDQFRDIPLYTVNSVFMTGVRDSVCLLHRGNHRAVLYWGILQLQCIAMLLQQNLLLP